MKVTIENKGSASLSIKGRHGFHIDAHSSVVVELPPMPRPLPPLPPVPPPEGRTAAPM